MTFHYLLMAGHAIYLKQLMAELNHTGLTPGQPKVLDYLMEHDGANQKEIANACHMKPRPSPNRAQPGMEPKSLIERRRGGRQPAADLFYVLSTDRGRKWAEKVTEAFAEDWRNMPCSRISLLKKGR
ncbi:MAG: MarR family transcriptional regulator [Enterocloster sp.]